MAHLSVAPLLGLGTRARDVSPMFAKLVNHGVVVHVVDPFIWRLARK